MKNLIIIILFSTLLDFPALNIQKVQDINPELNKTIPPSQSLQLNTDGLYYAEFFDYIFRGHFENVEITIEEMEFLMIFESYLRTFALNCEEYLPEPRAEIMNLECQTETVVRNGYGIETNRYCSEWRQKGSGLFARPELYNAKKQVENLQNADALRTTVAIMTHPNAEGNTVDLIHKTKGLKNDMQQIFKINPCDSPGIRRFEENLRLFALGKASIRMEEQSKYAHMKKSGGPSGSQDLIKLVDDLVKNQAQTWAFNRYIPGSISDLRVHSQDNNGRPIELKANYNYSGFSGKSNGWVQVTFNNGLPKCIYFFDYPNNCKNPGNSIVVSYANGDYGRD